MPNLNQNQDSIQEIQEIQNAQQNTQQNTQQDLTEDFTLDFTQETEDLMQEIVTANTYLSSLRDIMDISNRLSETNPESFTQAQVELLERIRNYDRDNITTLVDRVSNINPIMSSATQSRLLEELSNSWNLSQLEEERIINTINNTHASTNSTTSINPTNTLEQDNLSDWYNSNASYESDESDDYDGSDEYDFDNFYDSYLKSKGMPEEIVENYYIPYIDIRGYTEEMKIFMVNFIVNNRYVDYYSNISSRAEIEEVGLNNLPVGISEHTEDGFIVKDFNIYNLQSFLLFMIYNRLLFNRNDFTVYITYVFDRASLPEDLEEEKIEALKKGIRKYILYCLDIFATDTFLDDTLGVESREEVDKFIDELDSNADDINDCFTFLNAHMLVIGSEYTESIN